MCCSATSNNVLDKAIDAEDEIHHDFLRLVRLFSTTIETHHFLSPICWTETIQNMCILPLIWVLSSVRNFVLMQLYMYNNVGPCWRVSQAICKDQDILLHCCGLMGCRLLCQGGWRCSPKPRYYSLYAPLNPPTILDRFLIYLWRCAGMLVATLGRHKLKPRVYIGCMKSGPVLSDK